MDSRLFDPSVNRSRTHPGQHRRFARSNELNLRQTSFAPTPQSRLASADHHNATGLNVNFGSFNHPLAFAKPLFSPPSRITMRPVFVTFRTSGPPFIERVVDSPTIISPAA